MMYGRFGKRVLDVLLALPALLVLSPLLLAVALLVRLTSSGPVLFIQERMGCGGRPFPLYKFRTMTNRPRVPEHEIVGRTPDVTKLGYWLRRFKVDELPQFFNVLRGDMSLVGPRPALPTQLAEYDETAHKRLRVRPGLTGLAQINGNIHLSWPQRWEYDAAYVEQLSLALDLSILLRTVVVVLLGERHFFQALEPTTCELEGK